MPDGDANTEGSGLIAPDDRAALWQLEQDIRRDTDWFLAVLQTIGRWQAAAEEVDDRCYRYVIDGEAFDWLLLAERLCQAVAPRLPEAEVTALLHRGQPPRALSTEEFRRLIGQAKYRQHLNFFYGVTVEEALLTAVLKEVRKEQQTWHGKDDRGEIAEAYRRIYGVDQDILLEDFRQDKGYRRRRRIDLDEMKEFRYWLFKYRLRVSDPARIASDTRKGLDWLEAAGRLAFHHQDDGPPPP